VKDVYEQIREEAASSDEDIIYIIKQKEIETNFDYFLADENKEIIYSNRILLMIGGPDNPAKKTIGFDFRRYPEEAYQGDNPTIQKADREEGPPMDPNGNSDRIRLLGKFTQGDKTYYIAIRLSVKSISDELRTTNSFILIISTIALLMGGALVYFVARQIAKPIIAINQVAVNVSNMDFDTRAPENKLKDEIGSLARNINIMADRLEDNIKYLTEANKKLEEDNEYMNKVDEQRKEFIANISHELKTPLAILTGYTEMLNADVPGIDKEFYYETILDETSKMDILIKNLLGLTNMENSLAQLQTQELDITRLVEKICRKNEVLIKNKDILFEFQGKSACLVLGDPYYLEEAITNYLSNAINYTKAGGRIRVKVEPVEGEVVVSVFNEGINIPEENLDKLWNSFYREDKSRTRTSQNNVGLGLYIVRTIMNAHHGSYGVRNKENGVEFWISLKC
jgi:signal transduction histidine kinase